VAMVVASEVVGAMGAEGLAAGSEVMMEEQVRLVAVGVAATAV